MTKMHLKAANAGKGQEFSASVLTGEDESGRKTLDHLKPMKKLLLHELDHYPPPCSPASVGLSSG
jgi:hypothetical protein